MIWHHFPHHEPPDGPALWVRNWPFPGSAAICAYVGGSAWKFQCIHADLLFPAQVAYQWRLAPSPLPPPVVPRVLPDSRFRDMLDYQPEDQQLCWVRSCSEYSAPYKATYTAQSGGGYFEAIEAPGFVTAWWLIAVWRPAAS